MAGRPRTEKSYEDYLEYQRQASASYYARNKDKILAKQRQKRAEARQKRTEQQLKEEELLILEAEKKAKEDKIRALEEELAKLKGDDGDGK